MNIYKRGNIWWVEYVKDGKRHRHSTGTTKKTEAAEWVKHINVARKMPTFEAAVEVLRVLFAKPPEGVLAIGDAWTRYEELARAIGKLQIAERTLRDRKCHFGNFVTWLQKHAATVTTVEHVTGPIATKYAQELATAGLSTKSRRNIIGDLTVVWNVLAKSSDKISNPWTKLAPANTDSKRIEAFTPEEAERVLEAAREVGRDWYPMCVIARYTGLRYGDIAQLRWNQVDVEKGIINKTPSKTQRFGISVTIPLIRPVLDALAGLDRRGDYLFPIHAETYGKRGKAVQSLLSFRQVLDRAGLDDRYTFHSWRHTAATQLAEAGAPKEIRKMIMGHTTDENAARYDHAAHLDDMRKALEDSAAKSASSDARP